MLLGVPRFNNPTCCCNDPASSADEGAGGGLDPALPFRVVPQRVPHGLRDYSDKKWTGPLCISGCISQQLGPSLVAKCLVLALQSSCCLWHDRGLGQRACLFLSFWAWLSSRQLCGESSSGPWGCRHSGEGSFTIPRPTHRGPASLLLPAPGPAELAVAFQLCGERSPQSPHSQTMASEAFPGTARRRQAAFLAEASGAACP